MESANLVDDSAMAIKTEVIEIEPPPEDQTDPEVPSIQPERPYKYGCTTCKAKFIYERSLRLHERMRHGANEGKPKRSQEIIRCYLCQGKDMVLEDKNALRQHLLEKHEVNDVYHCKECDFSVDKVIKFNAHLSRHDPRSSPFSCSVCALRFVTMNGLQRHELLIHEIDNGRKRKQWFEKYKTCSICQKQFRFLSSLKQHELTHRPGELGSTTSDANLPCSGCERQFMDESSRAAHECSGDSSQNKRKLAETTNDERIFRCYLCKPADSFKTKRTLSNHLYSKHTAELLYKCEICHFKTQKKTIFNDHLTKHYTGQVQTEPTEFRCYLCESDVTFKTNQTLMKHLYAKHPSQPSYECESCGYKAVTRTKFNSHFAKHFETIFVAENHSKCEIKTEKVDVEDKEKEIKNIKPDPDQSAESTSQNKRRLVEVFRCYLCKPDVSTFKAHNTLLRHLYLEHPAQTPYECETCHYKTKTKTAFNSHLSQHFVSEVETELMQEVPEVTNTAATRCYLCKPEVEFNAKSTLMQHLYQEHPPQPLYECELCGFKTKAKTTFNLHFTKHYKVECKTEPGTLVSEDRSEVTIKTEIKTEYVEEAAM